MSVGFYKIIIAVFDNKILLSDNLMHTTKKLKRVIFFYKIKMVVVIFAKITILFLLINKKSRSLSGFNHDDDFLNIKKGLLASLFKSLSNFSFGGGGAKLI